MDSEFPSNSKSAHKVSQAPKEKESPKRVQKVISGSVTHRKKPWHRRVAESFTSGTDNHTVFEHLTLGLLIPAAKDLVLDMVNIGLEQKFYGEARGRTRRGYGSNANYTPYRTAGNGSLLRPDPRERDDPRLSGLRRTRSSRDLDDMVFPTRGDATLVLETLYEVLSNYDIVTVADLMDAAGEPSNPVDTKWGWEDLRGSDIIRVRDGYLLELPRPSDISN